MERNWTTGRCMRCEAPNVPVLWLGPLQSVEAGEAPFMVCAPCIRRLEALIHAYNRQDPQVPA